MARSAGSVGPALEQFVAGTGALRTDLAESQRLDGDRGAELLDEIGPAVLFTHSLGAPAGWLMADARPGLVRAIVAVEPVGPPFADTPFGTLAAGLTAAPMTPGNLAGIPVAVVTAEASPFAAFAGEVVVFLRDAGCPAEHLHLPEHGVRGNGHGVMLERNNAEALAPILAWVEANVPGIRDATQEE